MSDKTASDPERYKMDIQQNNVNTTGLACLQALFGQFRRSVNFAALITPEVRAEFEANPAETLMKLSAQQELRPELCDSLDSLGSYNGPVLYMVTGGSWVVVLNSVQLKNAAAAGIFDPSIQGPQKSVSVPSAQVKERFGGKLIIFRNLAQVDASRHTRLFCLSSIARHHNVPMDLRAVMHEYAIDDEEVKENLLFKIAGDYQFKIRKVRMIWDKLLRSQTVFPCIAIRNDGKYAVLCGFRRTQTGEIQAVLVDPEKESAGGEHFMFLDAPRFNESYTGEFILLKKTYKLSDEEQPFSLLWFVPEFIKLKGVFAQITLMVVMLTLLSLVTPLFFQIVVDKVLVNQSYNTLNVLGVVVIIAILFNGILEYVRSYLLLFATNKIDISTATKTFTHLMRLPIDFFERIPSGVLLKHMQQTEKIRGFLSGNLFFTILDMLSLVVFIPFLLFYSVHLTLVVLGFSALMACVIASLIKPFQRRLDELYRAEGKRQSMLVEAIHGVRTVKALALEPVECREWDNSTAYAIKSYFRVGKISMTARSISQILEMMMSIFVIWIGAHLVFDHVISIGVLIAFQMLANRVTGPLVKMVGLIHEYQQIALSVRMLGVVMNNPVEPAGGGVRNQLRGRIDYENVSFQYRPDLPMALKSLSLSIKEGETIGLVGRSGSGKTTITKLLQGLYPVTQGIIKIDGIDMREIDKAHLRRSIGVVLQDNYFFSGTVRQNICLTKQNATLEEIIYASKLAGADEFVAKMPRGYDTVLEENASNLSGGQRQRLAIARALLTNPPILIFDEATSALDPESESVIQQNLKAIARGRTVIIVSHRLSIVSHSDHIIVINAGEISDSGTHKELLSRPGIYNEFWTQQMRGDK
ncbi:MAG: peptidase domain-containing ABC transporter [Victivallaceae bacterium]|nr:peptidase domain-containing ABC transporter [Victivallaceae bacterium]